jgi:hypothetical protein
VRTNVSEGVPRERTRRRPLASGLVLAFALASAPSCGSERPSLGLRSHAGGAGGQAGAPAQGGGGRGGALTRPPTAGTAGVAVNKHVEPPGRSVFTVVHGIVDADATAWCFGRVRDGVTTLVGSPVPPGGLTYGQSLSLESIDGIDSAGDGVAPFVIAGDLTEIDGLDCVAAVARAEAVMQADRGATGAGGTGGQGGAAGEAAAEGGAGGEVAGAAGARARADAGAGNAEGGQGPAPTAGQGGEGGAAEPKPPSLRVGALPGLPAGTLAQGYSMLEVADGCLGARAFTSPSDQDACGVEYTPEQGSLSAEIVVLGRATMPNALALQGLNASHASGDLGLRTEPGPVDDGLAVTIVDDLAEGVLLPRDPRSDLPSSSWGVNLATWSLAGTVNGVTYATELWAGIRRHSGITQFEDGRGYTLIAIGPSIDLEVEGFWHPFAFTAVDNDPPVP